MEPTLAVIGLNFRTSSVAVRERFWISEPRRHEVLQQLVRSEGIDEVVVLTSCNGTEFILWTRDVPTAANSVLRFLTQEYQLKLCEWSHFYRLMDDAALTHIFQVAAALDSVVPGEAEITTQVEQAWVLAQEAGTTGRFLDAVLKKALAVSQRVRTETSVGPSNVSLSQAAMALSREVLGDLSGREVLVIGAGKMGELAARHLIEAGADRLKVMNRTLARAQELAQKLGATPVSYEGYVQHLESADVVVSSTACPHCILSRGDAIAIARARQHRPLVIVDMAVPRDIDPHVREIEGIYLFDMDDLERAVRRKSGDWRERMESANEIVGSEVLGFRRKLMAERVVPTILALRERLDELCRQELEVLRKEFGPFTADQDQAMTALTIHITQRIAGALARELRQLPERTDQDMLSAAIHRLFHLEQAEAVGLKNEN